MPASGILSQSVRPAVVLFGIVEPFGGRASLAAGRCPGWNDIGLVVREASGARARGMGPCPCLICSHALKSFVLDLTSSSSPCLVRHDGGASGILNLAYFWAPEGGEANFDLGLKGGGRGGGAKFEVGERDAAFDLGGGGGGSV